MSIAQKKDEIRKIPDEIPTVELNEILWANVLSFLNFVDIQDMVPSLPPPPQQQQQQQQQQTMKRNLSKDQEEQALRCTCKNLNQLLTSEEYYQIKVMETFANRRTRMDDSSTAAALLGHSFINANQWPSAESVGGWRSLHDNILTTYVPLEGVCTICNAWPWGLLVKCHFEDGKFCGDLIRAILVPLSDGTEGGGYKRVLDRIFEISFENNNQTCEIMVGNVSSREEGRQQQSTKALAHEFGISFEPATLLSNDYIMKQFPSCQNKDGDADGDGNAFLFKIYWDPIVKNHNLLRSTQFVWPPMGTHPHSWDEKVQGGPPHAHELIQGIQNTQWHSDNDGDIGDNGDEETSVDRSQLLLEPLGITLQMSDLPDQQSSQHNLEIAAQVSSSVAPLLKPGIYVGSYGSMYSCLRHEILHLSHIFVDAKSPTSLEEAFGSRVPRYHIFGHAEQSIGVIMVGRKVTGDTNVPAGEITWFADISKYSVTDTDTNTAPTTVEDQNGNRHRVVRSWDGMGTLAGPLFQRPIWDKGWLLELEGNLFAFCWSRFQQQEITILHEFPLHL